MSAADLQKWKKSLVGRKSKYTEEVKQTILKALREGYTKKDAATLAGISPKHLFEYTKLHQDFSDQVEASVLSFKHKMLKNIDRAAPKDWKAAAWRVERAFPNEFSERQMLLVHQKTEATVNVVLNSTGYIAPGNILGLPPSITRWNKPNDNVREANIVQSEDTKEDK